ncbi:MAG: DEAD/DEAH box helicase, partial [Planctomycetota bacterium]
QHVGTIGPILETAPESAGADDLLMTMLEFCEQRGIEPYPEQLDAFDAIAQGQSVVLNTPTGSGKSLVAAFAHYACYWAGWKQLDPEIAPHLRRSIYTAPIKALVNEKFFELCRDFGSRNVGLATGDATVNADAPMICCTAEVLAKMALRQGRTTPFGWVVMDEFHFYSDRERGSAWLIPLLEMTDAKFLLMSATLKDPEAIRRDLERRTGTLAVVVRSDDRPVPLEFEYRNALLLETVESVRERSLTPTYIVSMSKKETAELANQLRSTPVSESLREAAKADGKLIAARLQTHRMATPFGGKLERLLRAGIGVHHSGMLPKYRRIVEQLAKDGLVKLICGTDTLGVGVNMPIRSVVFRQLYKFDGVSTRIMSPQEFHQIAGRAGRKGHDDTGTVMVQAPEHEVKNERGRRKAAGKSKKYRPESPPRNFKGWNEKTLDKIKAAQPSDLVTRFEVTGPLVLQVLARSGDGREALTALIESVGENVEENLARADEILATFEEKQLISRLDAPGPDGAMYDLSGAEYLEPALDRPLAPFLNAAAARLDPEDPEHDLDVLSVVESILDDPGQILRAQARRERTKRYHELRSRDQTMEEKIAMDEELEQIEHPQPLKEEIAEAFRAWTAETPWIADRDPAPKSVARDLFEQGDTFSDYIKRYELLHEEGSLLRYLSDAYRLLCKSLAAELRTDGVNELVEDLGEMIRLVDTSVVDEWERFEDPDHVEEVPADEVGEAPPNPARAKKLLRRLVRARAFEWVKALARHADWAFESAGLSEDQVREAMTAYRSKYESIDAGPNGGAPDLFELDDEGRIEQVILDPDGDCQWVIEGQVDLATWLEHGEAVATVTRIGERTF